MSRSRWVLYLIQIFDPYTGNHWRSSQAAQDVDEVIIDCVALSVIIDCEGKGANRK